MPPKEKVSKAMIEGTAFEMTREYGFSAVTARKLAEKLGCSTQPIFRAYENMDELRTDLFYMSADFFLEHILRKSRRSPAYMGLALSYIEFARCEWVSPQTDTFIHPFASASEMVHDSPASFLFSLPQSLCLSHTRTYLTFSL